MGTSIPARHPLRQLFGALTEKTFTEHLGWPDLNVTTYVTNQHIGDFTLFMAGLFPEYLRRLKTAGLVYHKDFLVDYVKTGKRSYGIVAQMADQPAQDERPLFAKLSDNFELCVTGLGFVRSDLDRMKNPAYQQAKDLLLN
ncbi:MAG: uncharacterized protein K0S45_4138 [Nitrospira sp.]|nr:uncharacterized protein [Nitrospira sp.]